MKTLIKNGFIVDGSGRQPYHGDILIEGELIRHISAHLDEHPIGNCEGTLVIDAHSRVVCPGFIDTHTHTELTLFHEEALLPRISQGITTEIAGQDGLSVAPVKKEYRQLWSQHIASLTGELKRDWPWETVNEYFKAVTAVSPALNLGYLVPHGNLRMAVLGLEPVVAGKSELGKMKELLREGLDTGCYGMSTGLIYPPCSYADKKELIALCQVLAEHNKVFVLHQRSEAADIIESAREVIELGVETGVKVHFSHMKLAGKNNWHLLGQLLDLLKEADKLGVDLSYDQYPYTAGCTTLAVILPPWVQAGGTEQTVQRLKNRNTREEIRKNIAQGIPGWDNFVEIAGLDGIFITDTCHNKEVIGLNLVQLGAKYNMDPLDAAFDLLIEENLRVGMVDFYGNEESLISFMSHSKQNFCTDGLVENQPHPRVYGAFPRVLGRYVREQRVLSLEEAVKKMTHIPAQRFNITGRGLLMEGNFADIVIFNPVTVTDRSIYEEPCQVASGIDYVLVNGEITYKEGFINGQRRGKVLRQR